MRQSASVLVVAVLLPSLLIAAEPPNIQQLRSTYQSLAEREPRAARLVVELDRDVATHTMAAAARERNGTELRRKALLIESGNHELLGLDVAFNADLQKVYAGAAALGTPEASELLVRTALLHWSVLFRQDSMQGFHTEVEGLIDDPDCAGDIVGDRLLQAYFDTLFDTGADAPGKAIAALTALARQTACLGTQQSTLLASSLVMTYEELIRFLRFNGLYNLDAYVAQAAVQPLLLVYDVEKHRGTRSPLTHWFRERRSKLMDGVTAKRHPAVWHGLWLYDRRSGRMVGYKPTARPRDENDVSLASFYGSIATRPNLGDFSCSFAEMVERGDSPLGYFCAGSTCGQKTSGGGATPPGSPRGSATPAAAGTSTGRTGGFSTLAHAFEDTLCQESGAGDSSRPGSGTICGQGGLNVGGAMKAANAVRCLSQQVVRPGTEGFRCVAEAMGICSNPADRIAKELQDTSFAGVKLGRECDLGKGSSTSAAGTVDDDDLPPLPPPPPQSLTDAKNDVWLYEHVLDDKITAHQKVEKELKDEKGKPKKERDLDKIEQLKKQEREAREARKKADQELIKAKEKLAQEQKKQADEKKKKEEEEKRKKAEDEKKRKKEEEEKKKKGKGTPACPPGTPDCGDNTCTAIADQMGKAMACAQRAITGDDRDPHRTRPGGCDPTVCDPVEANGQGPATAKCLATLETDATVVAGHRCWAVECARGQATNHGCCGGEGGATVGALPAEGAGNQPMCSQLLCAEGSYPKVGAFGCECAERGGTGGVTVGGPGGGVIGGPTPRGSFTLAAPPAFLDKNTRARDSGELPPGRP